MPTGNTEFQFHVANLNFKSTAYDWLVVAGAKAQYNSTDAINGAGEYGSGSPRLMACWTVPHQDLG